MNRLKFRIWDKQNKKWLENSSSLHCYSNWTICPFTGNLVDYVGLIDGDNNDTFYADPADDYYLEGTKLVKEPRYVIQQYTGLKDKNGVLIFEGDILKVEFPEHLAPSLADFDVVKSESHIGVISMDRLGGYFCLSREGDFSLSRFYVWEVIGNIMQNPELIKNDE